MRVKLIPFRCFEGGSWYHNSSSASAFLGPDFAFPTAMPIVVGFLHGQEYPTIETVDVGPSHLGTGLRCVFDYGCSLGDFRAAQKATGAA